MSALSSTLLTSKLLSFISNNNNNNNNNNNKNNNNNNKTQLKFPTLAPTISLKPNTNNGLLVPKMGSYNVKIAAEDNESEERLLGRFRREVFRAGILQETKRRRFFECSQDKRKRKTREAAKKYRVRRPRPRVVKQDNVEIPKEKGAYNSDEDDWDLPEGDLL